MDDEIVHDCFYFSNVRSGNGVMSVMIIDQCMIPSAFSPAGYGRVGNSI